MTVIEGVDFSSTSNADWGTLANALKASGKHFAGRYCVGDKSPSGRGISGAEYNAMKAAGVDVFVYWESSEGWMTGGRAAGVAAAQNAQANLVAAGMPATMPIYFACDFDATPEQQAAIDDCLRGCASVIGLGRVGIYGGYWIVSRCAANGTAKWFAQTSAWSGGQWFSGNHLEQYSYNLFINNTNCDAVRALKANYGQASAFVTPVPAPEPKPTPAPKPKVTYPAGVDKGLAARWFGSVKGDDKKTYAFDEGNAVSQAWLAHGKATGFYPALESVQAFKDSPTVTRMYYRFASGYTLWQANDKTPISELKAA